MGFVLVLACMFFVGTMAFMAFIAFGTFHGLHSLRDLYRWGHDVGKITKTKSQMKLA
jgi:hypothetical protein